MTQPDTHQTPPLDQMIARSLCDIDIPPRPVIIDRISAAMQEDDPNLKFVGEMISQDVSLAASLIKTANSPYFGYRRKARSVLEAILMLGLGITCQAVASICLRKAFPDSNHYERFWDSSMRIAALSGWLAQRLRNPKLRADDAYTFGLFRDAGIVILLRRFPNYIDILGRANQEKSRPFTQIEHDDLPTDHSMLGCLLAQDWWLPEEMCLAIRHHHDQYALEYFDSGLPLSSRYMIAISQTAEYLLQRTTGGSQTYEWEKLGPICLRLLHLDNEELPALEDDAAHLLSTIS